MLDEHVENAEHDHSSFPSLVGRYRAGHAAAAHRTVPHDEPITTQSTEHGGKAMAKQTKQPRDGSGRYLRTVASAERDAEAARLRETGCGYRQIAEALGYCDKGEAWRGVQRALTAIVREPAERLRATEAARLDDLYVAALEVLERDHPMVSHGRVVTGEDGAPLLDDGPKLAALRELRAVRESYRRLHGLDASQAAEVTLRQTTAPATEDDRHARMDAVTAEIVRRTAAGQAPDAEDILSLPDGS